MLPDPYVTEILADTGFDWLLIDTEHSPNDLRNVMAQLQAAKASAASVVVRVRGNETALIKQYLDASGLPVTAADRDNPQFTRSVEVLMAKLYPHLKYAPLKGADELSSVDFTVGPSLLAAPT